MLSYPYRRIYVTLALLGLAALLAGLQACYRRSGTTPVPPAGALLVQHGPIKAPAHILVRT